MKKLILMACVPLLIIGGCKSRKVALTRIDSTVTTNTTKTTAIKETSIDTGKTTTVKQVVIQDSSGFKAVITPVPGKPFTIGRDGTFTGEASKVEISGQRKTNSTGSSKTTEQKGVSNTRTVDSTSQRKQEVRVQKKIKNVDSKPDYSWIFWVAGVLAVGYFIWKKFF